MPKLLDYILPAYNVLKAVDPSLPRALFVALVFLTVLAWRKLSPGSWQKFSSLIPVSDEDTSWFKATLLKVWQALPSALLGAVYGALGTGGNVVASLKLAALALLAPVVHELAWRYEGRLGTKKSPPSNPDTTARINPAHVDQTDVNTPPTFMIALVCLSLFAGCSLFTRDTAKSIVDIAHDLCVKHFSAAKPGVSLRDIEATYCKDLDPWVDSVLGAEKLGAAKANEARK